MPSLEVRVDTSGLQGYSALLRQADRMIAEVVERTVPRHHNEYLQPIQTADPGPSQHRGRWSTNPAANARARRGYWARVRAGLIPADPVTGAYIRTGNLARQWQLAAMRNKVVLFNESAAIKYVSTFGPFVPNGGQPNPGHLFTGWPQQNTALAQVLIRTMVRDVLRGVSSSIAASVAAGRYRVVVP
jgi:hypothetical protein